jgi:hypothetical protein
VPSPSPSSPLPARPDLPLAILTGLARLLDYGPATPFHVRIRQAQGFADAALVQGPREHWDAFAPRCGSDEWLGLARVRPAADSSPGTRLDLGALSSELRRLTNGGLDTPFAGPASQPYFQLGSFVCLSLDETIPLREPGQ